MEWRIWSSRRLYWLRLCLKSGQSEVDIRLVFMLVGETISWRFENSRMYDTLNHGLRGLRSEIRSYPDPTLWLTECNTPCAEPSLSWKDKADSDTWELITKRRVELRKIDAKLSIADCLKKPQPKESFNNLTGNMGLQQRWGTDTQA